MSCFVCFGSAAQDEEPRKPAAAGARKDATPDRAVAHVGSGTAAGSGAGSRTRPLPPAHGPQYVCTSFSTFICTNCSGIHREFSHRVKSVSMAKFTSQEVSALQEGGNEHAKEIYFKHWDLQGPVIDNSDVHRLRNFIKNVYVEHRYLDQRIGEHLAQAKIQGNQDSYGNSNADSSPGVLRSAYVGTYEDNHDLKRTKESLSENQNNSNGHPVSSTVDQNNNSTMAREKVDLKSHLRPDVLLKTDGKSENNQKVVISSASSTTQTSKEINSNKVFLPIKLPDLPRSQKATSSNTSTEAHVMQFL
ncbi:putative ADP-ribosylation factor GTPase-activating protein AGD14 [Zea mays]|uniref:Putative ADP-ribosylation factor GTPase-activating protein AGD14 n=1 Tax=Zea mays TaxID=4577 RepID=A0A3L6DA23_MAIZE|nr:putative ADP-ribosylation factor GTPase-activating protein AGD14 [Zea mays]